MQGGVTLAIIDVIKFNGLANRNWLIYRYPGESFVYGSQLIVGEGQVAVFVKGGKALDYFTAGTYTLKSANIPLLQPLINIPFGGRTPFSAEVFFINRTVKLDMFWGTTDPISLIDPKYNVRMRVRAFGQYGMRITDFRVFMTELIGAMGDHDIVKYDAVMNYFKGLTVTRVKTLIANMIINEKISVLEIAPQLEMLSEKAGESIAGEFERFGLAVINFFVTSVNFPDEDFEMINKILSERAKFDILGENRYNVKRSFDVMESAAGNEGGSNLTTAGIGLGLGTGAGYAVGQVFADTAGQVMKSSHKGPVCNGCGRENPPDSRFCGGCGGKLQPDKVPCSSCQTMVDHNMNFCPGCGNAMNKKKACPECQQDNPADTRFCSGCGTNLEG